MEGIYVTRVLEQKTKIRHSHALLEQWLQR
jgi:hypothetical protein